MKVTIRRADPRDAANIARVQVESWLSTYRGIVPDAFLASMNVEEQTRRALAHLAGTSILIFVAEDQEGLFGFVSGGASRETLDDYDGELYAIYLLAHRQKKGVGRLLCHTLASALRAGGFTSMAV